MDLEEIKLKKHRRSDFQQKNQKQKQLPAFFSDTDKIYVNHTYKLNQVFKY